nr:S8 family serine peptidase [uncultured Flavobacterium sp.]
MKARITYLLLFLVTTICFSQNFDKWKQYLESNNEKRCQKYNLSTLQNAYLHQYKVVKKLDDSFCIIENKSIITNKLPKETLTTNDLWKLPSNFSLHQQEELYIIATDDMKSLLDDLKSISLVPIEFIHDKLVSIRSNTDKMMQIIAFNSIVSVTQESFEPKTESKIVDQNFTVNNVTKANTYFPMITGDNQIISIKDDFFDLTDIDLLNKHILSTTQSTSVSSHASAMATIASGLGNSSVLGKGVAPKAKIQSSDYLKIFPDDISTFQGSTTQNHSYGTLIENFYGSLANAYDEQLFLNPNLTHCFSSGNKGSEGYKSITGNFKQSKNSIVIGCLDQEENILSFSSKGPAYDGRVKPEVVAYSTQGTSNATALVTGVITLMKQQYQSKNNVALTNAQTKAIIINSANDVGNIGPDFNYGYGNVDAYKALKTISENRIINGTLTSNQTNTHFITIPTNVKNLKVTIVWNDLPAAINSNISLINDLDLELIASNNTTYLPWILNPETPQQPATRGKDKINNIEQIVVENSTAERYTIKISSKNLASISQEYSIAYEYEVNNHFEWNYPLQNDNFPFDGRTISPFKWTSSFTGTTGQLSISYDDGQNWEIIANTIALDNKQFTFTPSEQRFSKAKLKMNIGGIDYLSETFTISYDLNINTSLVCDGTTEITWKKPKNVVAFNLYELIGDKMQFKTQTTNTSYTFSNEKTITVAPLLGNNEGIKSEATLQFPANSNCYFEFSFAEIFEEDKIKIRASLFSLYNIKKIELIKVVNTTESILATIDNINSKEFFFIDPTPSKGNNKYRINLVLQTNKTISSSVLDTNYLGNDSFFVYPTLLNKNQELIVEAKKEEASMFYLYSLNGQNTMTCPLLSKTNTVNLKINSVGVYVYKIVTSTGEAQTGKIAVF